MYGFWMDMLEDLPLALASSLRLCIIDLALQNEQTTPQGFYAELMHVLLSLLLFAKLHHAAPRGERQQLCRNILAVAPDTLEMNVARLLEFARLVVQLCADTGTLPFKVWEMFHELGKAWRPDTELMAGLNKFFEARNHDCTCNLAIIVELSDREPVRVGPNL